MSTDAAYEAGVIPPETLGWRMQRALGFAGLSVDQMSEELGVSRSTISRWLNDRGTPSLGYLKVWALRTGTPYSWLLGDELATQRHKRSRYQHQLSDSGETAPSTAEIKSFLKSTPLVRDAESSVTRSVAAS